MPPDDPHSIQRYFSRSAQRYHQHATLQRQIAAHLADHFLGTQQPDSILELGCGTGFLTQKLCDRFPQAAIDAIDISPEMIQLAQETLPDAPVRWQVADMNLWHRPQPYGLIASSTALHWANPLGTLVQNIRQQLAPGGNLVAAVMADGTLTELHQLRKELTPDRAAARQLPSEPQLQAALADAQLEICQWEQKTYRQTFTSAQDLFRTLRRSGFTGGPFASPTDRRLVRSELEQLIQLYQQRHEDSQGNVQATFQVIYLRAHCP